MGQNVLPTARQAGVCLHVTSLPGQYGIGEIGIEARHFIDTIKRMGLSVWQILPTGPTAYGDSPYQPLSTFAGNELLVDVAELRDLGLVEEAELTGLSQLPSDFVDYGRLIPEKNRVLSLAASRFHERAADELKQALADFVAENDDRWLHDYALYRVLKQDHDEAPWPEWRPEYVHRDSQALAALERDKATRIEETKLVQFLFFYQWRNLRDYANQRGIWIFGDMPIYIALDSADAWANREIVRIDEDGRPGAVAGVPPDYFSEDGQLWGNPLYNWSRHEQDGYQWWADRLQAASELVDIVRIDHFRGFESYWSVPADAETARDGQWLPGPGDAIFDAMRSRLGTLPIVAEDLGVITPEVEALRERHKIPGMVVLQFAAADENFSLEDVDENAVCYTGTHDNDTTLGWFYGEGDDVRQRDEIEATQKLVLKLAQGTPATIHIDLIRAAFATPARLAIAPMQDFLGLGSEARFNTPGTSGGNWRWRLQRSQITDSLCQQLAGLVRDSGRCA